MPTSGARNASGALSGPKARFHAQKTTPKATPRTAVTTMSTVRQRAPARAGPGTSWDGGRTAESAMVPPDSLRRHDPDQVRGSAVARTLSAEALPCRFSLVLATLDRVRVYGCGDQLLDPARVGAGPVDLPARLATGELRVGATGPLRQQAGHRRLR